MAEERPPTPPPDDEDDTPSTVEVPPPVPPDDDEDPPPSSSSTPAPATATPSPPSTTTSDSATTATSAGGDAAAVAIAGGSVARLRAQAAAAAAAAAADKDGKTDGAPAKVVKKIAVNPLFTAKQDEPEPKKPVAAKKSVTSLAKKPKGEATTTPATAAPASTPSELSPAPSPIPPSATTTATATTNDDKPARRPPSKKVFGAKFEPKVEAKTDATLAAAAITVTTTTTTTPAVTANKEEDTSSPPSIPSSPPPSLPASPPPPIPSSPPPVPSSAPPSVPSVPPPSASPSTSSLAVDTSKPKDGIDDESSPRPPPSPVAGEPAPAFAAVVAAASSSPSTAPSTSSPTDVPPIAGGGSDDVPAEPQTPVGKFAIKIEEPTPVRPRAASGANGDATPTPSAAAVAASSSPPSSDIDPSLEDVASRGASGAVTGEAKSRDRGVTAAPSTPSITVTTPGGSAQPKKGKIGDKFLAQTAAKKDDDLTTPKSRVASSSVGAKTASLSHKFSEQANEEAVKSPGGMAMGPGGIPKTPGKLKVGAALEATLKANVDDTPESRTRASTTAIGHKPSGKISALGGGLGALLAKGPGEKIRRSSGAAGDFSPMAMLAAEEHAKRSGGFAPDSDTSNGSVTPMRVETDPDFKLPDDSSDGGRTGSRGSRGNIADDDSAKPAAAIVHVGRAKIAGGRRKGTTLGFKGSGPSAQPQRAAGLSVVAATPKAVPSVTSSFPVSPRNGATSDTPKTETNGETSSDTPSTTTTDAATTNGDKPKEGDDTKVATPSDASDDTKPKEPTDATTPSIVTSDTPATKKDDDVSSPSIPPVVVPSSPVASSPPSIPSSPPPSLPTLPPPALPSTLPPLSPTNRDTPSATPAAAAKDDDPATTPTPAKVSAKKFGGIGLVMLSPEEKKKQDEAKRRAKTDADGTTATSSDEPKSESDMTDEEKEKAAAEKKERLKKLGGMNPLAMGMGMPIGGFMTPEQKKKKDEEAAKAKADAAKAKHDDEPSATPATTVVPATTAAPAVDEKPKTEKVLTEKPKAATTASSGAPAKLEKQGSSGKIGGIAAQLAAANATSGTGSGEHPKASRQDSKGPGRLIIPPAKAPDSPNPPSSSTGTASTTTGANTSQKKIPLGGFNPLGGMKMMSPEERRKKDEADAKARADREAANAETEAAASRDDGMSEAEKKAERLRKMGAVGFNPMSPRGKQGGAAPTFPPVEAKKEPSPSSPSSNDDEGGVAAAAAKAKEEKDAEEAAIAAAVKAKRDKEDADRAEADRIAAAEAKEKADADKANERKKADDAKAAAAAASATAAASAAEQKEEIKSKAAADTASTGDFDSAKADKYQKILSEPSVFLKHGKSGSPHDRTFEVNSKGVFYFGKPDKTGHTKLDTSTSVNIATIVRVVKGKQEADFKRSTAKASPDGCCISVVGKERTVNFQTKSQEIRDLYYEALHYAKAQMAKGEPYRK